jgi:ATP-dependent DNA helicase RecG
VIEHAKQALPWQLTRGQEEVLSEVLDDMRGPRAMLRLLQGDVGCGKTIVALLACLVTAASGERRVRPGHVVLWVL